MDTEDSESEDLPWIMAGDGHPTKAVLVLDRSGGGQVSIIPIDTGKGEIPSGKSEVQLWPQIKGLRDYAAVVVDNHLYIVGGFDTDRRYCVDKVWRYDPTSNKWEPKSGLTISRSKHTATAIGPYIYVSGGEKTDGAVLGSCEQYHTGTDLWSKIGALPAPRRLHACLLDKNGIMLVSGGLYGKSARRNIWAYEGSPIRWHELDEDYPQELPKGLHKHCMSSVDNTIYFIGGIANEASESKKGTPKQVCEGRIESFKPTVSASRTENEDLISPWDWRLPTMSIPRHSATTLTMGRNIFVLGGSSHGHPAGVSEVECFNVDTQEWSQPFNLPSANYGNVTSVVLNFPAGIWRKKENKSKLEPTEEQSIEDVIYEQTKRWVLW